MIWSQYYRIRCDACDAHYYVDNGDPSDLTAFDVEAAKCPWCGAIEKIGDGFDEDSVIGKKSLPEIPPKKGRV